ncbi:MAG: B12-binding domain-containing radical SAM protein [Deltaproteobacteria bacterium]|nr:B12-binding domain-containing radical SAM protein [Deltaproteobacteria bacterium]
MKKGFILVVNPWIHDFAAYDLWSAPLGLLTIAAVLRKNGFTLRYIDCLDSSHPDLKGEASLRLPQRKLDGRGKFPNAIIKKPEALKSIPRNYRRYGISPRLFREDLGQGEQPDLVMVTSLMTYWYKGVAETISAVRSVYPSVPVVLGGIYPTLCPDHAARYSGADIIVTGHNFDSIGAVLKECCGRSLESAPNPNDLDSMPYPALDLMRSPSFLPLLTSRGCPYSCTYCASSFLCEKFLVRDPLKIMEEVIYWHSEKDIANVCIYDDAFLADSAYRAIPFMRAILQANLPINFHCPNGLHLREITGEIANLLFRCRFSTIRFGFESALGKRQAATGGKVSTEELKEAVAALKRAGYEGQAIGVYLLCGLPGQEAEEIKEGILLIQRLGARPILAEYSPIPHTRLWDEAIKASVYNLQDEPLHHNNSLLPCRSESLSLETYQHLKMLTREPMNTCATAGESVD